MLTWKKLLPAVIVPTAFCLTAQASLSAAAEECRERPGLATPRGSHWYYRINRPDRRHCWFLAAEGRAVHTHRRETEAAASMPDTSTPVSSTPPASPTSHAELPRPSADAAPAQATLSQAALMAPGPGGPTDVAGSEPPLREIGTVTEFAARWPSPSGVRDLDDTKSGATRNANSEPQTTAVAVEAPTKWPVITAEWSGPALEGQEVPQQEALQTASLAGGAALALLFFAGWIVKAGGRSRLRLGAELAAIDGATWTPASPTGGPAARLPTPTDPGVDLKTSLAELMRDLRRVDARSHAPQSSARPTRHKRAVASSPRWGSSQ